MFFRIIWGRQEKRALKQCNKIDAIFGGGGGGSCNMLGKHGFCPGLSILQRNEDKLLAKAKLGIKCSKFVSCSSTFNCHCSIQKKMSGCSQQNLVHHTEIMQFLIMPEMIESTRQKHEILRVCPQFWPRCTT